MKNSSETAAAWRVAAEDRVRVPGRGQTDIAKNATAKCSGHGNEHSSVVVYTPKEVGEILGSAPETVIRWIREGQLKASNLATGSRPRFVIRPADIDDFLVKRQIDVAGNAIRRRTLPQS